VNKNFYAFLCVFFLNAEPFLFFNALKRVSSNYLSYKEKHGMNLHCYSLSEIFVPLDAEATHANRMFEIDRAAAMHREEMVAYSVYMHYNYGSDLDNEFLFVGTKNRPSPSLCASIEKELEEIQAKYNDCRQKEEKLVFSVCDKTAGRVFFKHYKGWASKRCMFARQDSYLYFAPLDATSGWRRLKILKDGFGSFYYDDLNREIEREDFHSWLDKARGLKRSESYFVEGRNNVVVGAPNNDEDDEFIASDSIVPPVGCSLITTPPLTYLDSFSVVEKNGVHTLHWHINEDRYVSKKVVNGHSIAIVRQDEKYILVDEATMDLLPVFKLSSGENVIQLGDEYYKLHDLKRVYVSSDLLSANYLLSKEEVMPIKELFETSVTTKKIGFFKRMFFIALNFVDCIKNKFTAL
jgi:hypothetical protein